MSRLVVSRALAACAALGVAGALVACSAVLGFESLTPYPSEGGSAPGEGGSAPGEGGSQDAKPSEDGAADGSTACAADLETDPKNCGRCAHDCLGGTCQERVCQPVKLADGLAVPEGLVVDDANVFVAEWDLNRIVRFGKDKLGPCASSPLPSQCVFNADQSNVWRPTAMGIDATSIYWANTGGNTEHEIRACARTGCGTGAAVLVAKLGVDALADWTGGSDALPLDLVVRDGHVFWPENLGGALRSAPVGGGPVKTYLQGGSFAPIAIAVDDTHVYFTDDTNQHPTQIQAVPRDGSGKVRVVAETQARPYGLDLSSDGNLYWTVPFISQDGDGLVQAAAKTADGGAPIGAIASAQFNPSAIMVDGSNVYWVLPGSKNAATGLVVTCPLKGCPVEGPTILARDQRQPRHLTHDDKAIYWSNEGLASSAAYDGQVWKIAKP